MSELELSQFHGTEGYTRYSPMLFPELLLTDGAKYVADNAGAYWLMDIIGSYLPKLNQAGETFAVAQLSKIGEKWKFMLVNDIPADSIYATQTIEFSDFPMDEFKLYVGAEGEFWVIMLPSEY